MAGKGRLLDEFDGESVSSGEEATFEEMQSRMSSLETMLQHARRERLNAVRHARSQLQRARVLMQRNQQTKFFLRKVISELEKSLEEYPDKPNQDPNDRTKVSLLFEGRLSKMFEDVSPLMSPGYTSPTIGSPLDSEFEVYKTPRRLSYGDELYFDEDGTSYLGNQHGSVSRNELYEYRLGNYGSSGMGVPFRRHEITVHRVEIRESRSNRRKSRRDSRPQREKSAEHGELRDVHWMERLPYDYDDVRRSAVSLRSSNYIQRPVLPQPRTSRAEAASFPRSPAGSMTLPARPSSSRAKSNSRAKGSSSKTKPRAQQQHDNRQVSRNKEQRNEKHPQRRVDSRSFASNAGDTRDLTINRGARKPDEKKSVGFSHSVHTVLVNQMANAPQHKVIIAARSTLDPAFIPSLTGSHKISSVGIHYGSSSASDKSKLLSAQSQQTSDDSTYAPRSTSDENSRGRNRAITLESTVVPPNSIEALKKERSERSVPTSLAESSSTEPSSVEGRSRTDTQWNQNIPKQGKIAVQHHEADILKATQERIFRPDKSILFQDTSKNREKSETQQDSRYTQKEERPRNVAIAKPDGRSSAHQLQLQPQPQTQVPRMQASATTQTIMTPFPPSGTDPSSQTLPASRVQSSLITPSRSLVELTSSNQPLTPQQNIEPSEQNQMQPQTQAQPPTSVTNQQSIRPPPVRPTSLPQPTSTLQPPSNSQPTFNCQPQSTSQLPSTLAPKFESSLQLPLEDQVPNVETPREVQPQVTKQPPPRPPPPTRLPLITPRPSTPLSSVPPPATPSRFVTPSISSKPLVTHPPHTNSQRTTTPSHASPQPHVTPSRSRTPSTYIPPAIRQSQSSRPLSLRATITSKSSTGSRSLSPTKPHLIQPRKPSSPRRSPPFKSPSPPKDFAAKSPSLTSSFLENLTKPQFPLANTVVLQSYQVSRSGASSPIVPRSSNPRPLSAVLNKLASAESDLTGRSSTRVSQEKRQPIIKQDSSSSSPSRLTPRTSVEARKYQTSPLHRSSVESRSFSFNKTPTGTPISRVAKTPVTEIMKEKSRTSSPATTNKRHTIREMRLSAEEGRELYSFVEQFGGPGGPSKSQYSPRPTNAPSPRRQTTSEKMMNATNMTKGPANTQARSRDTIRGFPAKSEGMKAMKARQLPTQKHTVINTGNSISGLAERRTTMPRRSPVAATHKVSTINKVQTLNTRTLPSSESKRLSLVPESPSHKRVSSVERHQRTIEPTPSEKRVALIQPQPKPADPSSADKGVTLKEPTQKVVTPTSSDKHLSEVETRPQTETKQTEKLEHPAGEKALGSPGIPLRLVSSDKHLSVSEKKEMPRQAPSLAELSSGTQAQTATEDRFKMLPTNAVKESQKDRPPSEMVPASEKIKSIPSDKSTPIVYQAHEKSLDMKISDTIKAESIQPHPKAAEGLRSHTVSAPISKTNIVLQESKTLTSLSEPTKLEKTPVKPFKIPPKGFKVSKPVTSHSEQLPAEMLQKKPSNEHVSSVASKPTTAMKGSHTDMDNETNSSTNVAERTDKIGDLPSITRQKYHKFRKDESAMNDDAERRKPSSAPNDPDLGETSEVEDHSLHGLIEFFC